jgi:hypothetical protein
LRQYERGDLPHLPWLDNAAFAIIKDLKEVLINNHVLATYCSLGILKNFTVNVFVFGIAKCQHSANVS